LVFFTLEGPVGGLRCDFKLKRLISV